MLTHTKFREMIAHNTSNNSITFISSLSAHRVNYPQPQASYNVSKAGIKHLARCLAAEWAVHGIRVNSVSPGYMDTILNEGEGLDKARKLWNARNPMGRMGQPMELQGPLVMLCSQAGSFISGADLKVDGGASVF
jgi:sorbose reductase